MSHETSPWQSPSPNDYAPAPKQASSWREALQDPLLQERALQIGKGIGFQALKGAAEGSGLVRIDDDGHVKARKLGVAKAIVRPTHTLRKAVQGSVSGARSGAVHETVHQARSLVSEAQNTYPSSPAPTAESYWRDTPTASSPNNDPFDLYGDLPQSTTTPAVDPFKTEKRKLFGRNKKDKVGEPSVYPSPAPAIEDQWGRSDAYYPPSPQPSQTAIDEVWGTAHSSSSAYDPNPFDAQPASVPEAIPSPRLGLRDRLMAGHNQRYNERLFAEAAQASQAAAVEAQANDPWRM